MTRRFSTSVVASFFAVSLIAGARPALAQSASVAVPSGAFRTVTSAPAAAPQPLPIPQQSSLSTERFLASWLLGAAGSFGGGYLGCAAVCFGEGEHVGYEFLGLGLGSSLGSGVIAGAVNGSVGKGVVGGLLGFGAGLGAMYAVGEITGGGDLPTIIAGSVVQGLFAAGLSAVWK